MNPHIRSSATTAVAFAGLALACVLSAGAARAGDRSADDLARDRAAILAMRGEYIVDFAFDETVRLQPGYERKPAMRSGADETVIVVEDSPGRIVLQHILVDAKSQHVTKHWRQDWVYQASNRFEFSADQTWTVHPVAPTLNQGAWTQCVYEVSDAPRYCGTGRWEHKDGVSTWTSDPSWRPLPRREYTKREDYNALSVVNRHTVTANGWTHEQFNTKVLRKPDGSQVELVREFGFNDYQRAEDIDFGAAYRYWDATRDFWAKVRARWDAYLTRAPGAHLKTEIDGMAMIIPLFEQAGTLEEGGTVGDDQIDAVFAKWVEPATSPATSPGASPAR
ncbi:DUF6607 family protein [Marilutibacter maris]|uniref:Secreted protein n=1 Tax=Marilutibacter maris TaxID=1605891 RepID=A0A2U9TCR9_9GAMM|nr:DUF6607 family protein [Lysobacter maris]AWV08278.1 hypothetical protein C9I47_2601 [Lysobacter maris]